MTHGTSGLTAEQRARQRIDAQQMTRTDASSVEQWWGELAGRPSRRSLSVTEPPQTVAVEYAWPARHPSH